MRIAGVIQRVIRSVYRRIEDGIYVARLPLSDDIFPVLKSVAVRKLLPSDSDLVHANFPKVKADDFLERLNTSTGFIALADQKIVGYAWLTSAIRPAEGEAPFIYPVQCAKGEAYLYDIFVSETHRRQGIGKSLVLAACHAASASKHESCFTLHDETNDDMIKVSVKVGFRRTGVISYKRVGPWVSQDISALTNRTRAAISSHP